MIGDTKNNPVISDYQPSQDVVELTTIVKKDYQTGVDILNFPWPELNERTVNDDENRGQMMFNGFVDTSVEDPAEAWKWRGTRSMARNKGIAMHANLTANFLLPLFTAQNENDEIDREFSEVMRDIVEWMTSPTVSNYQSSFLDVVFGMIQNPVTFMSAEYAEVFQKIRIKAEDGKYTTKEILDEVLSGFQAPVYSSSQVLITNAYMRNIQRQRRIIKRRWVEKSELEAKYGNHPSWDYVKEGQRAVLDVETGAFYDIKDDEHPFLVAEETVLTRLDDSEICYLGGVYMGEENIDDNPIHHRDNRGAPKYNVTPFGYSRIGQHFFYYKSMMNALGWDNMLYDAMSEIIMNRAMLEVEMPIAVSGTDQIDSDVIFPNSVVSFESETTRVTPLLPPSNLSGGFAALRETEKSITEGSVNETTSGQLPDANQKAYNVAQAQAAAKKLIKGVGQSLAESVVWYGDLMKDIVINHITAPQVDELVGGGMKLKYRSFLLTNKSSGGKVNDKYIHFDESLIGKEMSDVEKKYANVGLLEEADDKQSLIRINPELFAKFKYLSRADTEELFVKNQEYWQPILLNLKASLAADPYTNQEFLTRKIGYAYFQSEGDDMVKQPDPVQQDPNDPNATTDAYGSQVKNKLLSTASAGAMAE